MSEKNYSHDPHIWPIDIRPCFPLTLAAFAEAVDGTSYEIEDIAKSLVILAEMAVERLQRVEITAPPKPKPEPEGDDDIPDAA